MEKEPTPITIVKSPAKDAHKRKGTGFSLKEIEDAGKTTDLLRKLNIKIDYFRKSAQLENIEMLKSLKAPKLEKRKKKPFVLKEKKKTPFKPKVEKIKPKAKKPVEEKPKTAPAKPVPKPKKKEKVKAAKVKEISAKPTGTPLTELSGLGGATANKFIELGVNNVEDLCKENPEELAALIKRVSLDRLKKWIGEGKELMK
ncbi:MAG: ribosomal protein L13e [Candidatus Lokiarchaeota archaeon]|nr:ribosomal protein L13e [Candidatus Lokiarchaeota archaeon]